MGRRVGGVVLAAILAVGARGVVAAQKPPSFPSETSVITVDVVVVDKKGEPVTGLEQDDFTVLEDGQAQTITAFEARNLERGVLAPDTPRPPRVATNQEGSAGPGRVLAFVVDDTSLSPLQGGAAVKSSLTQWLKERSDPRDEVTIVTTSGDVWWSARVAAGKDDLLAVIDRIEGRRPMGSPSERMSDSEAAQIAILSSPAPCTSEGRDIIGGARCRVLARWMDSGACAIAVLPGGEIVGKEACEHAVRRKADAVHAHTLRRQRATLGVVERISRGWEGHRGRKSILVLSEGFIEIPQTDQDRLAVAAAQRSNVAVYYVDVRGLLADGLFSAERRGAPAAAAATDVATAMLDDFALATAGGESLAEATGGLAVVNTNDVLPGLTRATEETGRYYLLGYTPPSPNDGRWHELRVDVHRSGVSVRARKGYLASGGDPDEASVASREEKEPGALLDPALVVAATHEHIPLRLTARAVAQGEEGMRVLVGLDVGVSALTFATEGQGRVASMDVAVLGVSRERPRFAPIEQRVTLRPQGDTADTWWGFTRELELPPGPAQIKAMVRDVATGRVGTVAQQIHVPASLPAAPRELVQSVGVFQLAPTDGLRDAQMRIEATPAVVDDVSESHLVLRARIEDRAGKTVEEWTHQWAPVVVGGVSSPVLGHQRSLSLPPGEYLLESTALDLASGAVSVAYEPFAVPERDSLALGTVALLGDGAPIEAETAASDTDPFVVGQVRFRPLLGRRVVQGTPHLPLLMHVYAERPPEELSMAILRGDESLADVAVTPPEMDASGHGVWLGTLPTRSFPPGDYQVVLRAREGDAGVETRTSFEVVAPSAPRAALPDAPSPTASAQEVDDPELAVLLAKAGQYVVSYAEAFRDLVAEEAYQQDYYERGRGMPQRRITRADIVFTTLGGPFLWGTFRDVHTVDGHPVRDREARLEKLFLRGDREAMEEAREIRNESARYNVGVARSINEPTLPLMFLHPGNQARFRFTMKERRREAIEVRYRETQHPTLISDDDGKNLPCSGRFWLDPNTGAILRSEISLELTRQVGESDFGYRADSGTAMARIDVRYREAPGLAILVPDEMKERYPQTTARAVYSHYRRFSVETHEAIGLGD